MKKEHQRNLVFIILFILGFGAGYTMHWSGPNSGGSTSYQGGPFPWIIETRGINPQIRFNFINLGLNMALYLGISEILVFRIGRIKKIIRPGEHA